MLMKTSILLARTTVLLATAFLAADYHSARAEILPGHSYHGEAFNEGPRQAAYLMGDTGRINFPVTTTSEESQKFINQGIGQLHGFWYFESERSFRQAVLIDPDCAMAYWGMAMANVNNEKRAREFISKAEQLSEQVTDRERRYIEALGLYRKQDKRKDKERRGRLVEDYEAIIKAYPDDLEAKALVSVLRWQNSSKGFPIKDKERAAIEARLQEVLAVEPLHPVHHYRIHLWDIGSSTNAVNSAGLCGFASPATAHMWHMPGHIYSRHKRYSDAAWQQEASARTDHAYMMRNHVLPDQIHNFAHNNEWLIRNLNNIGAVGRAMDLAKNMIELPRHPKYNTLTRGSSNYGIQRLLETAVRYELWGELNALAGTHYLKVSGNRDHEIRRHHALGLATFHTGLIADGQKHIAALEKIETEIKKSAAKKAAKPAAKSAAKPATKSASETSPKSNPAAKSKGKGSTKGRSRKPSNVLLATGSSIAAAIAELRTLEALKKEDKDGAAKWLAKASAVAQERLSRLHFELGDRKKALELAVKAVSSGAKQSQPLANYIDLAWRADRKDDANKRFEELRENAAEIDLQAPVFARLAPVAKARGLSNDWRPELKRPSDFGQRPSHDSLGPFRWQPPTASKWSLPKHDGSTLSLSDYRGKPVIVIFYLGHGCAHCIEQLAAFVPLTEKFAGIGVSLVGISTDNAAGLNKTEEKASKEIAFPFPLLADPTLDVFKKYRAYDDFEKVALHGTFLISSDGKILWQDISYEPFLKTDFLLEEAERQLNLSHPANVAATGSR